MLLKRVQKENIIEATYESSNILASKYNKDTKDLTITFKRGAQYTYKGVSQSDYFRFETADSQGVVLNSHIKVYSFEKGDVVDSKVIEEEIQRLKALEDEENQKSIIKDMEKFISEYDIDGNFNIESVIKLTNKINNYISNKNNG